MTNVRRGLSIRALKERAETVRQSVLSANAATAEELTAKQPGGALNPDRSVDGWLLWLIYLHRLDASAFRAPVPNQRGKEDAGLLEAIRSEPIPIVLTPFGPDGDAHRVVLVRPLSFVALAELDKRDTILCWLAANTAALGSAANDAASLDLYARSLDEIIYQQRVCASIVTAEAAPRLYFDPLTTPRPDPADVTADMDPLDFVRIMRAHAEVNAWRLQAIQPLLNKEAGGDRGRAGWGTFFATLERDRGEPSAHYMRDVGLVPLVAARVAAPAAEREAKEQAKQKAERESKRNGRSRGRGA